MLRLLRSPWLAAVLAAAAGPAGAAAGDMAPLPGAERFRTVAPPAEDSDTVAVAAYRLDVRPVTNQEFLAFVTRHPEWHRGSAPALFVDENYLAHWAGPLTLGGAAGPEQPVTHVSWFAARAYCQARGKRLPSWAEWEFAAAADEHQADARDKAQWRQRILAWYSETGGSVLADVGGRPPNFYGVQDLHGLVWEWVEDYNALLVSADNRSQGGADKLQFCGAGALSMEQKENYAVLMRVAMLSSLEGRDTTRNLGFRCATDAITREQGK